MPIAAGPNGPPASLRDQALVDVVAAGRRRRRARADGDRRREDAPAAAEERQALRGEVDDHARAHRAGVDRCGADVAGDAVRLDRQLDADTSAARSRGRARCRSTRKKVGKRFTFSRPKRANGLSCPAGGRRGTLERTTAATATFGAARRARRPCGSCGASLGGRGSRPRGRLRRNRPARAASGSTRAAASSHDYEPSRQARFPNRHNFVTRLGVVASDERRYGSDKDMGQSVLHRKRLHRHSGVRTYVLLQRLGIPYEVERTVCSECRRVLDERPLKRAAA